MCQPTTDSRITLSAVVTLLALVLLSLGCGGGPNERLQLYSEGAAEEFVDPELEPFKGDLSEMRERRLIRALVTPSRTDFFVDSGQIRGIQAEFLQQFAQRLNRGVRDETERVRIKYVPVPFNELIPALLDGRGDVAAAFLTVTEGRRTEVTFAAPFRRSVSEVLVTHESTKAPEDWSGLAGERVYVLRGSAYAEHLRDLNEELRGEGLEPIEIEEADARLRSEDVLEFVNAGVVERTVIDDYKAELWQKVLPDIRVHDSLALTSGGRVAWAVRPGSRKLKVEIDAFVRNAREGALLGNILLERYFGDVTWLENPNSSSERDKLRRYLDLFREYGDRFGFDPLAIAAQAYQESGLDHESRSPAGAVGLMQILPSTAADPNVDVSDIDDPEGNVHAATKYLAFIRDRYFDEPELSDWDRRAFTWAAYNAGPRKIREARALAKRMGLDPDRWFGNVEVAAGRSIGREPVRYVDNIYRYYVAYRMSWLHESERREAAEDLG